VRALCGDTAECGAPTKFPDRELVADLVTAYYTDIEPEHSWVAEHEGKVVGYLNGCLDSRRWWRALRRLALPAVLRSVGRGVLWRRETWRVLLAGSRQLGQPGIPRARLFAEYPAHVHINVRTGLRGQTVGRQLFEKFEAQARTAGVAGIHANVHAENAGGQAFFACLGFSPLARGAAVIYGKRL